MCVSFSCRVGKTDNAITPTTRASFVDKKDNMARDGLLLSTSLWF